MGEPYHSHAPPNGGYGGDIHEDGYGQKRGRSDDFGPNKRQAGGAQTETVYRFLCDANLVGGLIGRGGANIQEVQQNTGAFIQAIQEVPPQCPEKVFVIASPRDPPPGSPFNAAQRALFELFEKHLLLVRSPPGSALRMLICGTQAGSLIGKGGVTIKEMKDNSGVENIKVLQPSDLPPCALASDKLLHITGSPDSLRKVLELTSQRLRDSPPKEMPSQEPCQNAMPRGGPPMGPPGGGGRGPPMGPGGGPPPGYGPPPPGGGYGPPRY